MNRVKINIALYNVAQARCNYDQKQSVIRRIPEISSLNIYSNVKLNRTTAGETQCYCPPNRKGRSAGWRWFGVWKLLCFIVEGKFIPLCDVQEDTYCTIGNLSVEIKCLVKIKYIVYLSRINKLKLFSTYGSRFNVNICRAVIFYTPVLFPATAHGLVFAVLRLSATYCNHRVPKPWISAPPTQEISNTARHLETAV